MRHREAETRFISTFMFFIQPSWSQYLGGNESDIPKRSCIPTGHHAPYTSRNCNEIATSASVGLSDDTDVLVILLCNPSIHNQNVVHFLNDTVHFLDVAMCQLELLGLCGKDVSMEFAMAGCYFNPSFFGITHEVFLYTLPSNKDVFRNLDVTLDGDRGVFDFYICLVYLQKYGREVMCNKEIARRRIHELMDTSVDNFSSRHIESIQKSIFVSEHDIGSRGWKEDVRNYIADKATTAK